MDNTKGGFLKILSEKIEKRSGPGRPRKDERIVRNLNLTIRVNESEKSFIKTAAKNADMTVTDLILTAVRLYVTRRL